MPSPYSHTPSGTPGEPQRRRLPPPALLRAVLGPALAMAAGLSLLRLALWLCQGTWGRGLPLYRTLWDAAGAVTAGLASALAAGLIASVSLVALMGRAGPLLSQAQAVGYQRIARAMLLASLPLILALTVLPLAGGHLAMDLRAASLAAFLPPFLVIVLCPLLLVLASHASLRCGTGLCISVLTISVLAERALAGTHEAVELRAELLLDEGGWSTLEGDPEHPPWVGVLTPSMEQRREKADLPSLFLPPPAIVELGPTPARAGLHLRTRVGIDRSSLEALEPGEELSVRFRLRINGEQAFEATTTRSAGEPESGADWILVGGPGGLPVPPRARIELQTELVSGKLLRGVPAGFARLALVEAQAIPARRSGPESPNVVLVVMDTERFDRTTGGGSKRALTPSLERLAERGTLFSNAHATSSWTWPSTASILTGLLPEEHGVLESRQSFLASELETLAEVLQREGFATAAFSGNPLLQSSRNFDQGFQTFESTQAGVFRDSDVLVPRALEWVRETAPARFFLYLHLVDPHVPHDVPLEKLAEFGARRPGDFPAKGMNEYQALIVRGEGFSPTGVPLARDWIPPRHLRWMVDLYEAAVWTGDLWLGRLLDGLEELGLEGETVIAFTSDHGEELLDHGQLKHGPSLHPELVRVPLVLAGPGVPRGRVVEVALSNRHLASTLAALAGADGALGATDALDLARPGDLRPGPVFFSTRLGFWNGQRRQGLYGVLRDGWALHLNPAGLDWGEEPGEATPRPQARLYQRERDPQERQDRASARPDLVRELMQLVEARRAASESRAPRALDAGGVATEAMLRDIGYIDGE